MFATHVALTQLESDNGPPFNSKKFEQFAYNEGSHHHVTPEHACTNGEAQNFMKRWKLKRSPVYHLAQHKRIYNMTSASTLRRVEMFVLRYETSDNLWDSKNSTRNFSPLYEFKGSKLIRLMGSSGVIKIFTINILVCRSGEISAIDRLINYKLAKEFIGP